MSAAAGRDESRTPARRLDTETARRFSARAAAAKSTASVSALIGVGQSKTS